MMKTMTVTRRILHYSDPANNSDKFYQVYITPIGTLLNWGRWGTDGQTKWHPADSAIEAEDFAYSKIYEKRAKGYIEKPLSCFEMTWISSAPSLYELRHAYNESVKAGTLTKGADRLANEAEGFAAEVSKLVASVKRGEADPSALMGRISGLEGSLKRAEDAIADAKLGLEMARMVVGRRVSS